MAKPLFTSANAREMAAKAHESRRQRTLAAQLANAPETQPTLAATLVAEDPLANKFTRALTKTLDKYLACDDSKELASIARSMREVRETYHLYSGAPKPGTIKPERVSSRQQVKQPSEPKLDTTGSGSAS
jgi:hypothetical protein